MSKISAYTAKTTPATTDEFLINDVAGGSVNKKMTWENLTESGAFAPTIEGGTTTGSGTYTYQVGEYVRIGKLMHAKVRMAWTAHTGTGEMRFRLTGLPNADDFHAISIGSASGLTWGSGQLSGEITELDNYVRLRNITSGAADSAVSIDTSVTNFSFDVTYRIP